MTDFMKKQSVGAYFNIVSAILGLVGIIAAVVCSKMTLTYALGNLGTVITFGCAGIVLCLWQWYFQICLVIMILQVQSAF